MNTSQTIAQQVHEFATQRKKDNKKYEHYDLSHVLSNVIDAQKHLINDEIFANLGKYLHIFNDKSAILLNDEEITIFSKEEKDKIKSVRKELIKERDRPSDGFYSLNNEYSDSDFDLYF